MCVRSTTSSVLIPLVWGASVGGLSLRCLAFTIYNLPFTRVLQSGVNRRNAPTPLQFTRQSLVVAPSTEQIEVVTVNADEPHAVNISESCVVFRYTYR